jgi:hypothetical protein
MKKLILALMLVPPFGGISVAEEFDCNTEIVFSACSHIGLMKGVECGGGLAKAYGPVIHNGPPYNVIRENMVEYHFDLSCGGSFALSVRFASAEGRIVMVSVNNDGQSSRSFSGASVSTGGWGMEYQEWSNSMAVDLEEGPNELRFTNFCPRPCLPFPHISAIRLKLLRRD